MVDMVVKEEEVLPFAVWVILDGRLCIVISLIRSVAAGVHVLATYCIDYILRYVRLCQI